LVPCEGFHAKALVMWQPFMGPVNKGSIVVSK